MADLMSAQPNAQPDAQAAAQLGAQPEVNPVQPGAKPEAGGGFTQTAEKFIAEIYAKSKPEDVQSLKKIVAAGMKVMFSKETHQYMTEMLDKEGEISGKLGYGIGELMGVLFQESKGRIPGQLIMPAAAILLVNACEFIERTGEEMNMDIFSEALQILTAGLKQNLEALGSKQGQPGQQGQPPGQQGMPQGAPQPAQSAPPQPGGLMNAQPQGV